MVIVRWKGGLDDNGQCNPTIQVHPFSEKYECVPDSGDCLCLNYYYTKDDKGKYDFTVTMNGVTSPPQKAKVWKAPDGCGDNVDRVRERKRTTLVFFE